MSNANKFLISDHYLILKLLQLTEPSSLHQVFFYGQTMFFCYRGGVNDMKR